MRVRSVSLSLPSHGEIEVLFPPPFPFRHLRVSVANKRSRHVRFSFPNPLHVVRSGSRVINRRRENATQCKSGAATVSSW